MDTYKEAKIIEFPGMVARVFIPILEEDERKRRLAAIHKAAANLLENYERSKAK